MSFNNNIFPTYTYTSLMEDITLRTYTGQNNIENDINVTHNISYKTTELGKILKKGLSTDTDWFFDCENDSINNSQNDDEKIRDYYYIKDDKGKMYTKEKRKTKSIFAIIYNPGFIKKKKIIKRNKNNKFGYNTSKKSGRYLNIRDKIIRNIIQDVIPNWINYKENDINKILKKLKPSTIKDINKIKNKLLEEIYKFDITQKGNINKYHNINIINNIDDNNIKKIKFKFTLNEIIKILIDNENLKTNILIQKYPELLDKEEKERKIFIDNFYEGLNIKAYLEGITGPEDYKNKFKDCFLKFITENSEL